MFPLLLSSSVIAILLLKRLRTLVFPPLFPSVLFVLKQLSAFLPAVLPPNSIILRRSDAVLPTVTAAQPGAYMVGVLQSDPTIVAITAADPTQTRTQLTLSLAGVALDGSRTAIKCTSSGSSTVVTIALPTGLYAGSAVVGSCGGK